MKRAYRFRIYPNKNQEIKLNRTISACRHLYNDALSQRLIFKKKYILRYNSFTYPQSGFSIENGKLNLSKIGSIKMVMHREIEGKIKTSTIKKDVDQWYVSFSCEIEMPIAPVETEIGIDVGLNSLITMDKPFPLFNTTKISENILTGNALRL